ncbi:MAG TPA: DUF5941 domain-containing protein [Streptosporangiaceae bacterium]
MTVALVLAAEADAGMCGQLAALGVRRVDLAGPEADGAGLLTVAAAARMAGERVMLCVGDGPVPGEVLARLLETTGTSVFSGGQVGALVVDTADLDELADAAESIATTARNLDGRQSPDALGAIVGELARRGVSTQILDDGPDGEGACAQLLIDPLARDAARWALSRDLAPTSICGISLGFGLIAATWFTSPTLAAKLVAVLALGAAFVTGRAGALVAASGRWPATALDWLGSASSLLIEFGVYAALALCGTGGLIGLHTIWGGPGNLGIWRLAMAAMGMLAVRRLAELCYDRAVADGREGGSAAMRRFEQAITLPTGERYLVIVVTDIFFGPRVTLLVLLCWGAVASAYLLTGRMVGSALMTALLGKPGVPGPQPRTTPAGIDDLAAYRNDGWMAREVGLIVSGRLTPLLPAAVGVVVTAVLAALGLANLPGVLMLTPVEAMLLAALGSRHPHDGRRDWLVPPLLLLGEFLYMAALGLAHQVPPVAVYSLLAAVVLRHVDVAYRARHGAGISADIYGLGWDGRMLLVGLGAMTGQAPLVYVAFSGYLWLLFGWDFLGGWLADT